MGNIWKNCNFSCYATRIPSPSCAAWAAWAWPFFQVMDRHQVCKPWLPWTTWPWTTWLWWVVAGQMAVMLGRCWKMDSNPEDFFWTGTSQNRGYDGYECHLQILGNPFRIEVTCHFFFWFFWDVFWDSPLPGGWNPPPRPVFLLVGIGGTGREWSWLKHA